MIPSTPKAVMFDLDGTLADTLQAITDSGNHLRAAYGKTPLPPQQYRYLAGQGVNRLASDSLELTEPESIDQAVAVFRKHYDAHGDANTRPYPGIIQLLDALQEARVPLAVLSNKPHEATVRCVGRLFPNHAFAAVVGHQPPCPVKPDPTSALAITQKLQIPPEHWLYVGDTKVDMLTAHAAGMYPVGVTWGFRPEEELQEHGAASIIHHPSQLLDILRSPKPAA